MIYTLAPEIDVCSPGELKATKLPELKHVIVMGSVENFTGLWSFEEVHSLGGDAEKKRLLQIEKTLKPDDAINIQFTSGTTGQPKGATLSHHNIVNNANLLTDRINLTEIDRLAIPVPLYHCFGMVMGVLGAVSKGAAMIFPGEAFDPKSTLDSLVKEKCTAVYGVPTMFVAILQELDVSPKKII
jgi:fatty-acyl-CoA synthase